MAKTVKSFCIVMNLLLNGIFISAGFSQPAGFIAMDDSVKLMQKFYDTDTVVVVLPDGYDLKPEDAALIRDFVFWKEKPFYEFRHESQLITTDSGKHLLFSGPVHAYTHIAKADLPVTPLKYGFSYKGEQFCLPGDGFYYIGDNADRLYICRNGEDAPLSYLGYLTSAYQFYILRGDRIIYSGFRPGRGKTEQMNNLDDLRKRYFGKLIRTKYADFYVAASITDTTGLGSALLDFDRYVDGMCHYLSVEPADVPRFVTYFYNSREELQYFIAAPLWQTVYGKSTGNINHVTGLSMTICRHEAGHTIIGATIGKAPSAFFDEGFRQATDYYFSPEAYQHDLEVFRTHHQYLTPALINGEGVEFFRAMENYSISGVFVDYLIAKTDFNEFKDAYADHTLDQLISKYGFNWEILIKNLKKDLSVQ
ncbi:hypothetical protein [Lentimicrobium sp.]|uniref:hypothetical protein n=2 Tax=Lentimicrobium sp. TaxID=2034841 RepID=UPI00345E7858